MRANEPLVSEVGERAQEGMVPPVRMGRPAFEEPLGRDALVAAVHELAERFPELVTLQRLGQTRQGIAIEALVLTDPKTGPPADKPGLFVLGDVDGERIGASEAALAFGWQLLSEEPEGLRGVLEDACVVLLVTPDPDALQAAGNGAPESGATAYERNFPSGWLPERLRTGSGMIPLARPATLVLARTLAEREHLVLLAGTFPARESVPVGTDLLPAADRRVLSGLLSGSRAGGFGTWRLPDRPQGSAFDYATFARGIYGIGWPRVGMGSETVEGDGTPFAARVLALAERMAVLLTWLPRLRLDLESPSRLANGLWSVDLRVRNDGALPTESALSAAAGARRPLRLDVQGARLVAVATRYAEDSSYRLATSGRLPAPDEQGASQGTPDAPLSLGGLGPEEERWLRLVFEGRPGDQVVLGIDGAWVRRAVRTFVVP